MISNNIFFTGLNVDRKTMPDLRAQQLEKTLAPLSNSIGEALDVKITSNGDQLCLNIANKNAPEQVTTTNLDGNNSPEEIQTTLSSLLIKKLAQRTNSQTEQITQLQNLIKNLEFSYGTIVHNLNNPLAVILGNAELLQLDTDNPDIIMKNSSTIIDSAHKMRSMVQQLLEVVKIGTDRNKLNKKPINVHELFSNSINNHTPAAQQKNITISRCIETEIAPLNLDPKFEDALDNLMSNAIKFSHPGSTISLSAKQDGKNAIIIVEDQGQGIPKEDLPKLFIPFAKIDSQPTAGESSNGLGLASVKKIVEAHGGTIEATSTVGEGTKFIIKLPLK